MFFHQTDAALTGKKKEPRYSTSVEALPLFPLLSFSPPIHPPVHPSLAKVGQKKDAAWQIIHLSDEAAC